MRRMLMGAIGALALLGGAGLATVSGGPDIGRAIEEAKPSKAPQQKKQALGQAIDAREQELQRRQRWVARGYRYRKDGQTRSAGDRAHKRMKQRRRGGK